eukprot:2950869-Alexandrium_andersonii.AAC.1
MLGWPQPWPFGGVALCGGPRTSTPMARPPRLRGRSGALGVRRCGRREGRRLKSSRSSGTT